MSWQQFTRQPKPDGPEIFKGHWRQRDQLRKEVVLAKNFENREIRMSYVLDFVPWSWRDIVCTCELFGTGTKKCPRCGKYARWKFMRSCKTCSRPFIRDFYHPEDKGSRCFDCLVTQYGLMGGENFITVKPREIADVTAEGVFNIPDIPTFDF